MHRRLIPLLLLLAVVGGVAFVCTIGVSAAPAEVRVASPSEPAASESAAPPTHTTEGVAQGMSVAVHGGTMSVRPVSTTVTLQWDATAHRYRGHVSFEVVDARGTLAGWSMAARIALPPGMHPDVVRVRPSRPSVVDGDEAGLVASSPSAVRSGGSAALGRAEMGHGGGTYVVAADLEVSGLDARHPAALTVAVVPTLT